MSNNPAYDKALESFKTAIIKQVLAGAIQGIHILPDWLWKQFKQSFDAGWSACGKAIMEQLKKMRTRTDPAALWLLVFPLAAGLYWLIRLIRWII